ncbi:MAG: hypothetical protein KDB72_14710 [Mycobacterium sp.]|nr:hypothetical protein [Mycobacterium sp.]
MAKLLIQGGSGQRGYSTGGDVLVNLTADGVDLNQIWAEIRDALALYNSERSTITRLLSYPTTLAADAAPQTSSTNESFDRATEFGIPTAIREPADYLKLGFTFHDYDKATRYSWRFLREATADQVSAQITRILEADNRLVTGTIFNRLLSPTEAANEWGHRVFGLWNGTDGFAPPPYLGRTFNSSVTHYLTTQSATLDSADVEDAVRLLKIKGYGLQPGQQLLILANQDDAEHMTAWRAGVEYATGKTPKFDFIPSAAMPAYLSNETVHGAIPPTDYNGLRVWGSYADAWLTLSNYIPAGYVIVACTGGLDSDINPVGFRQHVNPAYHGLRHIPGHWQNYPLIESFFARGFGVGVRNRGAAVVVQVTENSHYTAPTIAT